MLDYDKLQISKIRYPEDCERIQRVAKEHGEEITLTEAHYIWDDYSDLYSAGWLCLPDSDDDLWFRIKDYFREEDED